MNNDVTKKICDKTIDKKSIVRTAAQVGGSTMIGKIFGIIREITLANFLGIGAMSDAFIIAFKIPNTLRLLFAEGALSAAIVPSVVETLRNKNKSAVNKFVLLAFLTFEGVLITLCILAIWKANFIIGFCAPGFTPEKAEFCSKLLKILMPFIFFISSSAVLAGPLQAVGHFFIPAISPALINILFVVGILICTAFGLPIETFCYFILFIGLIQFILHVFTYFKLGFAIEKFDKDSLSSFWHVMKKFVPCLFSMSIVEIDAFIDTSFGSYLPDGSVSLINLAERFMSIPLTVFGVAFATILLPYFSKLIIYAPKRMGFFILESTKFVFWAALPLVITMIFISDKIFSTLFSKKLNLLQAHLAGNILIAYLFAVFFFSLNKILLNVFYSFHSMWIPTIISIAGVIVNFSMNMLLVKTFSCVGLATATTISAIVQTILYIILLKKIFNIKFYIFKLLKFLTRYIVQLAITFTLFYFIYNFAYKSINLLPIELSNFLLLKFGFWLWVLPLELLIFWIIYRTRKVFSVKLYFIDW
jgi:putative peptidoglycan lipid II flippase